MDVVTLDAQAADNGLALMLQGLIAESIVNSDDKRRDFEAMASTFGIVAPDAEVTVTLAGGARFTARYRLATTLTDPVAETVPATRGDDAAEYRELVASGLAAALTEPGW